MGIIIERLALPSLTRMPQSLRIIELYYWPTLQIKSLLADCKLKICLLYGNKNKQPMHFYCLLDFSFAFLLEKCNWFLFPLLNYLSHETISHRILLRLCRLFKWLKNHFNDLNYVGVLSNYIGLKCKIYLQGKMLVIERLLLK